MAACYWMAPCIVYAQVAWAQPAPEPEVPQEPTRRVPIRRRPAAPAPTTPLAPPTPAPTRPQAPADVPTSIKPFETGIEYKATPPGTRITFNLEDAGLTELVRLISQITGRRFILPSKIREIKATVFAPTQVTAAEAYQAFLSILEINGLSVVPAGRYLKIVETAGIEKQP